MTQQSNPINRRALMTAAAWTAPVVTLAALTPRVSASGTPDLKVTSVTATPVWVRCKGNATWIFKVQNVGDGPTDPTKPITVTWQLPTSANITYSFSGTAPAGWTRTVSSKTVTYTSSTVMVAGQTTTFSTSATITKIVGAGNSLALKATIKDGSGGDTTTANNSYTTYFSATHDDTCA